MCIKINSQNNNLPFACTSYLSNPNVQISFFALGLATLIVAAGIAQMRIDAGNISFFILDAVLLTGVGSLSMIIATISLIYHRCAKRVLKEEAKEIPSNIVVPSESNKSSESFSADLYCDNEISFKELSYHFPKGIQHKGLLAYRDGPAKANRLVLVFTPNNIESDLLFADSAPDDSIFYNAFYNFKNYENNLMIIINNKQAERWKKDGVEMIRPQQNQQHAGGEFAKDLMVKHQQGRLLFTNDSEFSKKLKQFLNNSEKH